MDELQNRYAWKATMKDGRIVSEGEMIVGAMLVSIVPNDARLPRHEIAGLTFVRRFGRGFMNVLGGGMRDYLHCIVCEQCRIYVRSTDGSVIVTPPDHELYL